MKKTISRSSELRSRIYKQVDNLIKASSPGSMDYGEYVRAMACIPASRLVFSKAAKRLQQEIDKVAAANKVSLVSLVTAGHWNPGRARAEARIKALEITRQAIYFFYVQYVKDNGGALALCEKELSRRISGAFARFQEAHANLVEYISWANQRKRQ